MRKLLLAIAMLMALLVPVQAVSAAYLPLGNACSTAGTDSPKNTPTVCKGGTTDPNATLRKVSAVIAWIAGIAAVIIIIISGFMFITSGGDAQKTASARNALIGAIVGLVIIVAAQSILLFVLSRVK